jgi:hypothetical protein
MVANIMEPSELTLAISVKRELKQALRNNF